MNSLQTHTQKATRERNPYKDKAPKRIDDVAEKLEDIAEELETVAPILFAITDSLDAKAPGAQAIEGGGYFVKRIASDVRQLSRDIYDQPERGTS